MDELKEAVYGVLAVSLSSGALMLVRDRDGKMLAYVRYFLSLILILLLFSPLYSLLSEGLPRFAGGGTENVDGRWTEAQASFERVSVADVQYRTERSTAVLISAKTGIPTEAIEVSLSLDTTDMTAICITGVSVVVKGAEYRVISDKVCRITEEMLLCPCTLTVEDR